MSRKLMHTPVGWDWPLNKVWEGYQQPEDADEETWEPTEPPAGDGWQLWEDVSEGSPITPSFATSEELIAHLVEHEGWRRTAAVQFIADGWAPSLVMIDGHFLKGAEDAD